MSYEKDKKSLALLMYVGAFKKYKPRNKEEEDILNNLEREGIVRKLARKKVYVLDDLDEIYGRLSEEGVRAIQNNRNQEADYPQGQF